MSPDIHVMRLAGGEMQVIFVPALQYALEVLCKISKGFWFKLGDPPNGRGVHGSFFFGRGYKHRLSHFEEVHSLLTYGAFGLQGIVGSLTNRPTLSMSHGKKPLFMLHCGLRSMGIILLLASLICIITGNFYFQELGFVIFVFVIFF